MHSLVNIVEEDKDIDLSIENRAEESAFMSKDSIREIYNTDNNSKPLLTTYISLPHLKFELF